MIFEKIYEMDNLRSAWSKIRAGKSPPGIDRITCEAFEKSLEINLHTLQRQLRDESYRPMPVVVFNKHKKNGSRTIGISTIRDKVVQQAVLRVMTPRFESDFLPCCYAYRRGRSALSAVQQAVKLVKSGCLWVLQMDVRNFFDTMDHGILLELIGANIDEKPLKRLVSRLLKAKICKEMGLFDTIEGSQQGSGLSPLLSNIYMLPIDRFMWKQYGEAYLRFSDDISVFGTEKEPLEKTRRLIGRCLNEIKLEVNEDKTVLAHVSSGVIYMGYHIDTNGKGPSQKSVNQIQHKLNTYQKVRKTDNIAEKVKEISTVIRGWYNYYKTLKPIDPPNILSLMAQASLARELGETNLTRQLLKQSKQFEHNHPDLSLILADLFLSMGMENQAMREYGRALKLDPNNEAAKTKVRSLQKGEEDIHKAIEKVRLVLHHNPSYQEGYQKLTEYYSRLGLFGFAEKAHEKALEIDEENSDPPPEVPLSHQTGKETFDYRSIDQALFLELFAGRRNAHAKQWVDEQGRWGFMRVDRPLKKKDIHRHLQGETTLGVYPVTEDDKVRFIVFDVDTAKRIILESSPETLDAFRKKAHEDVLRLKTVCEGMKLKLYLEDSGYKGRHGWLFFDRPVPASAALGLGRQIIEKAGGPSDNMIWELFPMGKSDRHKSIIKLPLGINRKNKRRCLFLREDNEPIRDQSLFLRTLVFNTAEPVMDIAEKQETAMKADPFASLSKGLKKMVENCTLLNHFICKARDTNYLTHYERICLLYTLSFAGKEGEALLHRVIGYCVNYNRDYTQRQIERRKSSPISCPKIAEYFPELIETLGCKCRFNLPKSGYPSPVMYLLESEIEQANPPPETTGDDAPAAEPKPFVDPAPEETSPLPDEEEKIQPVVLDFEKLLAEEFGDTALPESFQENETDSQEETAAADASFPEKMPEDETLIPAGMGAEGGASDIPDQEEKETQTDSVSAVPREEPLVPAGSFAADEQGHTGPSDDPLIGLVLDLAALLQQQHRVNQQVNACMQRLNSRFESLGSEVIETPLGQLKRLKQTDGSVKWAFETLSFDL